MTTEEYEAALKAAERELSQATTSEDVRRVWRRHFGVLGHRTLGRLLLGRSAEELLTRRAERSERD
jgi:hypothetical protein